MFTDDGIHTHGANHNHQGGEELQAALGGGARGGIGEALACHVDPASCAVATAAVVAAATVDASITPTITSKASYALHAQGLA